jgi:putative hydrolase of the HAD superfamily
MVSLKAMTKALMFDLDNTLYSEHTGMETMVLERINGFVSAFLGWPAGETHARRREGARRYGTTLEWLVYEKGLKDVEGYFSFVHPVGEEACLSDDEGLRRFLDSLECRKIVLTNAPIEHAERVLKTLGIRDRFSDIYDIKYNNLIGKPHPKSYLRALEASGLSLETTVFIDDSPKYVKGYLALGGRAILKDEGERFANLGLERIMTLDELPAIL